MAEFGTALTKVNDIYFPMIQKQLDGNGIIMDGYAKQCTLNALAAINTALASKGINWNDGQLDQSTITDVLMRIASLKLNASASPREVYFQLRNVSVKVRDPEGKEVTIWKKQIEMGIEGDGNDAILAKFGRGIKKVGQFWLVREGDTFEYPQYSGFDVTPPKWIPTGKGDVIRVVYPVLKDDDSIEFYIGEREDVAKNLIAHINNNLMNETFGICGKRFDATPDQKKKIDERKHALLKKAKDLGLAALDEPELEKWISPAWTEYQSREAMIIRKMRNNVVKKIPKDFGNAFIELTYDTTTDETAGRVQREIAQHANSEIIDVESVEVENTAKPEPEPPSKSPVENASNGASTVSEGPDF